MTFGEPLDPRYVNFRDGWDAYILGQPRQTELHWNPWPSASAWRKFPSSHWQFVDFSADTTPSPLDLDYRDDFNNPTYKWKFGIPNMTQLWEDISNVYDRIREQHPGSVWNPYDGGWREAQWVGPPMQDGNTSPGDASWTATGDQP